MQLLFNIRIKANQHALKLAVMSAAFQSYLTMKSLHRYCMQCQRKKVAKSQCHYSSNTNIINNDVNLPTLFLQHTITINATEEICENDRR